MKKLFRVSFVTCVAVGGAVLLASCGQQASPPAGQPGNTLERIRQKGSVRVGFANEAPYAYIDQRTGKLTGEAPEIARAIFKKMGVTEMQGVLTEFGSMIPGLKARRFDIIAAGMYITPERCQEASFSDPSYKINEALIVRAGNPKGLHSYEDIAGTGDARIGVVVGTVERGYAQEIGIPDERIMVFPDPPSALAGVLSGRVDAYAGTSLTVSRLLSQADSDQLERAEPFHDPVINGKKAVGYGAFVFHPEDTAFREEFNRHLNDFIGTERHLALVEPFGFTKENLPGDVTAEELCRPQ